MNRAAQEIGPRAVAGGVIALVWAIALQVSKPDRVRNATRIEDVAPAAPMDLGL